MFGNLGGMLSQVQNMQDGLKEVVVEVAVAEEAVKVTMNGVQNLMAVQIAPELLTDAEKLENILLEGLNLAQKESRNKIQEQVAKMTGINVASFANMFKG